MTITLKKGVIVEKTLQNTQSVSANKRGCILYNYGHFTQ